MTSDYASFAIDSTLELVADAFNIEVNDSELFRQASPADRVSLALGLLDGTQQKTISQITQGVIDEYEITITPNNVNGRVRGRDPAALLLDSYFKKRYVRLPAPPTISTFVPPIGAIPEVQGRFMASAVAAEVAASAGLTLSYETIDYEFQATFEAVGRVIDILRNIIRPWTFVEPFRTDILVENTTVILRQRPFPVTTPTYFLTLNEVRRKQVTIRKRKSKKIGILTLRGAKISESLSPDPDNALTGGFNNLFISGEQTEEDLQENFSPPGVLQSIVHTTSVYQMPAHILLRSTKEEFARDASGMVLKTRETIDNRWTAVAFDTSGQQGQPKQEESLIRRSRIDKSDDTNTFRLWEIENIGYAYNGSGFLTGETDVTRKLDLSAGAGGQFINSIQTIKTIRSKGNQLVEQIVTDYVWNEADEDWDFVTRRTQTQGGFAPGGPGRAAPISRTTSGQPGIGGSRQLELTIVLSTDNDAQDIEISDENLDLATLQQLQAQFIAVQGLFEYELIFDGIGMPFIQRGKTVAFVGIQAEDGSLLNIPAIIMTSVRSKYMEKGDKSEYTLNATGFGWQAT
jgi:hypothetical protein